MVDNLLAKARGLSLRTGTHKHALSLTCEPYCKAKNVLRMSNAISFGLTLPLWTNLTWVLTYFDQLTDICLKGRLIINALFQGNIIRDLSCNKIACPIHNIRDADAGTYTCTVTNEIKGEQHSESRSLTVEVIGELSSDTSRGELQNVPRPSVCPSVCPFDLLS